MARKVCVKAESRQLMHEWTKKMKAYVEKNEPGTLEYNCARKTQGSSDGEDVYVIWERYKDLDAFKM